MAWERYKDYILECPHHGFDELHLLNLFYRGIEDRYRIILDSASNGNFSLNTREEALVEIKNMAKSGCEFCTVRILQDAEAIPSYNNTLESRCGMSKKKVNFRIPISETIFSKEEIFQLEINEEGSEEDCRVEQLKDELIEALKKHGHNAVK